MTDEDIIGLYFARDESAVTETRASYGRLIQSVAYGILRSRQDAEECENETLLRVWNSIPPARPERLPAYLCRIARRLSLDRLDYNSAAKRSGEKLPIDELAEYIGGSGGADDLLSADILKGYLNAFLRAQDRDTRVIFLRRFWFGESPAEIAERLHAREGTIKSRLSRSLKRLREYLRKEGYDL